jgi:pantoate--beta-alanine ligase
VEQVTSKEEVRQTVGPARRDGRTVALVPTMGALHEGHLSLVRAACARADLVVVSIFVNPTQFGPGEDLDAYPRDLPRDLKALAAEGVDVVFAPNPEAMYEPDAQVTVDPGALANDLEGAVRPGHFRGVATVVTKLLDIVQPDLAFFGEKDYQQLLIVKRVARELDLPVGIVGMPTVREPDGLARSSRNAYLTPEDRAVAPLLKDAIDAAAALAAQGEADVAGLEAAMAEVLLRADTLVLDYLVVRDAGTLAPIFTLEAGRPARALAAVRLASARLIDNGPVVLGGVCP